MIFNSLGSNYSFSFALQFLWSRKSDRTDKKLKSLLAKRYDGQAWLYYRGRAALSEAVRLCQSDYVITNSFSCYAVEQAIRAAGSKSVFADIDAMFFHFSIKQLQAMHQAHPQAKAVIVQNTFGIGIKIQPILDYCRRNKLYLIEDLAHCPGNRYADGPSFGTVGDLVVLSFGRDKQIDVVNGGALIVRNQDLADKVVSPQPLSGRWSQRFLDRLYPLLISWVRFAYRIPTIGKVFHRLFSFLGLLKAANAGPLLYNAGLPSNRSLFVLRKFTNIEKDRQRRRRLMGVYNGLLANTNSCLDNQSLLRYPLVLSSPAIKTLMLRKLKAQGFYLNDNWYDDFVYPVRFRHVSSYETGSCKTKEDVMKRVVNLPLHMNMTVNTARTLATTASLYRALHFQTKFNAQTWQKLRHEFNPENCNMLTSWEEGEAYKALGKKLWRFAVYHDQRVVALVTAVLVSAKRGRFLQVAGNPLFNSKDADLQRLVIEQLKQIALKEKCVFVRVQPYLSDTESNRQLMENLNLRVSQSNLNAPNTLKIDLTRPLEKILSSRKYKNTRNCINQARRLKLRVVEDNSLQSLKRFLDLLRQTQQSQKFISNPFSFIEAQFKAYKKSKKLHLYHVLNATDSQDPEEVLAAAFIIDNGSEAAYLYGASSKSGQQLKAPYILQWHIMAKAQERGLRIYNLWGVAPASAKANHRFIGVTRFKKKFTSQRHDYLPTYDLVLSKLHYLPVYLLEKYEKKKRHL